MHIKKGDHVIIITGKDKGTKGKVIEVIRKHGQVIVENANMKKKHQKARKGGQKGQIVEFASPMSASNVMLIDPKSGKPTRVGYKFDNGKKVRIARKSGATI